LATLDEEGCLDGMPFMPEMLEHCGKVLRVFKRAHKACDTIYQSGTRTLTDTVHLESSRCDGSAHGGCQAQCMLFWKVAWLRPLSPGGATMATSAARGCSRAELHAATADGPRYSCQATRMLSATKPLSGYDLRQYVEDLRSGNIDLPTLLRGTFYRFSAYAIRRCAWLGEYVPLSEELAHALLGLYDAVQSQLPDGVPFPRRAGAIPKGQRTPEGLDVALFRPGSLVRVKSYEEILETLDTDNKNRGLYFDAENVPYCGMELRVHSLVEHIIDEKTGHMLRFKTPALILAGAYCRGTYSDKRMFCPRAVYPYWRTAWVTLIAGADREPGL
jgi:hypothetical protein